MTGTGTTGGHFSKNSTVADKGDAAKASAEKLKRPSAIQTVVSGFQWHIGHTMRFRNGKIGVLASINNIGNKVIARLEGEAIPGHNLSQGFDCITCREGKARE